MNSNSLYKSLLDSYTKVKYELNETEKTIRRITGGRSPDELERESKSERERDRRGSTKDFTSRKDREKQTANTPYSSTKKEREEKDRFSTGGKRKLDVRMDPEESFDEDDDLASKKKPGLKSTVVPKTNTSRRVRIERDNDSNVKARNIRMFGALMGTLKKFENEEKKRKDKETRRAEIMKKVEAATEEERERIKQEKNELFISRREKKAEMRCLEKKIERAKSHDTFEAVHKNLLNFIMTQKSKIPIFFLPKSHTPVTKKALEDSRMKIKEIMKKQKQALEADLEEIDGWYRKDPVPVDKENKSPKEEVKPQDNPETEVESVVVEQEESGQEHEESSNKKISSLFDQEFEPIYD